MIIHRHVLPLPPEARGSVVAVGNFDGVHFGHQAVIGEAVKRARAEHKPAAVLTFEPHPRRFFQPKAPPFLLTRFRTKARTMAGLGIEHLFVLRFNAAMARLTAEEFIDDVLANGLAAAHVVIGYDFVFGRGRAGNADLLVARLAGRGIGTAIVAPVTSMTDSMTVSSTSVRNALSAGDPPAATLLLGRPFEIEARVMRGDARGRTIGFPTANLWLGDYLRPALGVYAVRVAIAEPGARRGRSLAESADWVDGVANLGLRPTFGGLTEPRLEVHLFDYAGDLYGRRLRVALIEFLRPERKFDGIEALKAQIVRDAAAARAVLADHPTHRQAG
ncbi:MAG: bifunctional riboflavin kinase/FAD synthetase [Alphaproteobacteria bacterium]|nr:bifunctional riboflavin kinase/FAD synthetase [Alphaproteobacteria bacterium]